MKRLLLFLCLTASGVAAASLPAYARLSTDSVSAQSAYTLPTSEDDVPDSYSENQEPHSTSAYAASQADIWKYNKKIMLGFSTGTIDQKVRFGGKLSSRWGLSLYSGRNIFLHRKAIGNFLRFGLNVNMNLNYINFAKGKGSLNDFISGSPAQDKDEDSDIGVNLGRHFLSAGVAVGPTASFAPFYMSANKNLAVLRFRPYFNVVPSYAGYIVSEDDDLELHNAFALWCAAGIEIQWNGKAPQQASRA